MAFGFLFLKSLMPTIFADSHSSCFEFSHVHKFKMKDRSFGPRYEANDDDDCHEGKSIFSYSLFPEPVFLRPNSLTKVSFKPVWVLNNNFKVPFLEPTRKPPRLIEKA